MNKLIAVLLPVAFLIALVALSSNIGFGRNNQLSQAPSSGQPPQSSDLQVTKVLIDEVKLLRLAIERSQADSVVIQAVLERARSQQDQVNFISQRLDNVRSEVASSQGSLPRFAQNLLELENRIKSEEDDKARAALQRDYKDTQTAYEQQKLLEEQQRLQVDNLSSQLQVEQAKLSQVNEQLDRLVQEAQSQSKLNSAKRSR